MHCQFICPACGAHYPTNKPIWRCECGSFLDLDFMPALDRSRLPEEKNLWRYHQVLPLDDFQSAISFNEGFTPLVPMEFWGMPVLGKMDFLMPSGSFKDRGAAIMVNKCSELGIKEIVEDSSGNSACSVAAYCARANIKAHIYMPAGNSAGKTVQVRAYGAELHLIDGNRIDCANAALEGAKKSYYAAHAWNPFFLHGTKTVIYEIVEQMNWQAPDYYFAPVGSGSQILGVYIGLIEMKRAGIIDRIPKLMAVQSNKCSPLKNYAEGKPTPIYTHNPSIAEGIAIHKPIRLKQIVEAVQKTGGDFVTVDDADIIEALKASSLQGVYIEPTSASAVAALKQYAGHIRKNQKVVVSLTGSGLKSSAKIDILLKHMYNL
ncbi:MAG: threonine synthase [Rikenellaceae bacterium]